MTKTVYRYHFDEDVPAEEIEATLLLALLATQSLHGESRVRLDTSHVFDPEHLCCAIDASNQVGLDLNRLFVGFLTREFGEDSFRVERIQEPMPRQPQPAGAVS
jgi:hypothetical protein